MLLLALLKADLDSVSWAIIKKNISFADADLRTADLHGTNLNGIDLRRAGWKEAICKAANFSMPT